MKTKGIKKKKSLYLIEESGKCKESQIETTVETNAGVRKPEL